MNRFWSVLQCIRPGVGLTLVKTQPSGKAMGVGKKKILRGEKNVPLRGHFVARKKAFKLYGVGQEEGGRGGVDFGAFG